MKIRNMTSWVCTTGCLLLVMAAGCGRGDGRATVKGNVWLDGAPLESGSIALVPSPGSSGVAAGGVIKNGTYSITKKGPLPGEYQVQITAWRKTGQMVPAPTIGPVAKEGEMVEQTEQYIPEKYNESSELTVEIQPGHNRHDFELTVDQALSQNPNK